MCIFDEFKNVFTYFSYSFVKPSDSNQKIAKFCGSYKPPAIRRLSELEFTMEEVEIIFYSDTANIDGGFNLTYAYMNGLLIHLLLNII